MKGIIFNLVEGVVTRDRGEDEWDDVLLKAGLDGVYTALGNYPDEELFRLVDAASVLFGTSPEALTRYLGEHTLTGLADRYPQYVAAMPDARTFLRGLDDVIHHEVRKLHPDARPPRFWYDDDVPGEPLVMHYFSERRMCVFAEGMIVGAARLFGQSAEVTQEQCMLSGADHCILRVRLGN